MNPEEWQAEIEQLRAQQKTIEDRIRTLRSALNGPHVTPVLVLRDGEEEPVDWGPYTVEHAFEMLEAFRDSDDYGMYYDAQGVSVGGYLITEPQWKRDERSRQGAWDAFVKSLEPARVEAGEALLSNPGQAYLLLNGLSYKPEGSAEEKHVPKGAVVTDLPGSAISWMLDQGVIKGLCEGDGLDSDYCDCEWCRYAALKDVDREWLLAHGWNPPDRPKL